MKTKQLSPVIIIDIETVSEQPRLEHLDEAMQAHWQHKSSFLKLTETEADPGISYQNRAGIYAEFGKIICIGLGVIDSKKKQIRIKSISDHDEYTLLQTFCETIKEMADAHTSLVFCGHNIKEFDLPYICRRCAILGISLPKNLQLTGLKPWEIPHIDTLDLWRFGDYKHYISLDLLARILKIPSSKVEMHGSEVSHTYWQEQDLAKIARYCMGDIYTTGLVYLHLSQQNGGGYEPYYV